MILLVEIPVHRCYLVIPYAWRGMGIVVIGQPTSVALITSELLPRMHSGD